jgi:NAD(P)-dependent dehydrogenase (short-subunit alcohol dehydrogenase family)
LWKSRSHLDRHPQAQHPGGFINGGLSRSRRGKECGSDRVVLAIETDFGGGVVCDNPELNKYLAAQTALCRVGLPDNIGGAIASLLSEENRWVNAQRIEVSGGMFL